MKNQIRRRFPVLIGATAAIALAASLAGCNPSTSDQQMTTTLPSLPATLPLGAGPATNWPTAPAAAALPAAPPLRTVRVADGGENYGYADAAYDYQDVLGDAPPDYYFDYDGVEPWAWEAGDQSRVFVEPIDDGYRYYYYRPGADTPYFVRDPNYGYGFDGDNLAVVYDDFGGVVPYADYGPRAEYAARYFGRGRDLFAASRRAQRRAVIAADWAARSAAIAEARTRWMGLRERQPQWRDFHARDAARDAGYWRQEAVRRQADTRRFADWRAQDFRTPSPPRAIPAAWTKASWASDRARFLPARADRSGADGPQPGREATGGPGRDRGEARDPGAMPAAASPRSQRAIAGGRGSPDTGPIRAMREAKNSPAGARIDGRSGADGDRAATRDAQAAATPRGGRPDRARSGDAGPARADRRPGPDRPAARSPQQPARSAAQRDGGDGRAARPAEAQRPARMEASRRQSQPRAEQPPRQAQPRAEAPRAQPEAQSRPAAQPARALGGGGAPGGRASGGAPGGRGGRDHHG